MIKNDQIIIITFVFLLGMMFGIGISSEIAIQGISDALAISASENKILNINDDLYIIEKYNISEMKHYENITIGEIKYGK